MKKPYTTADMKRVVEMYANGVLIKTIMSEIGCSKDTIDRWVNASGVRKRHIKHTRKKPLGDGNHQSG